MALFHTTEMQLDCQSQAAEIPSNEWFSIPRKEAPKDHGKLCANFCMICERQIHIPGGGLIDAPNVPEGNLLLPFVVIPRRDFPLFVCHSRRESASSLAVACSSLVILNAVKDPCISSLHGPSF
jgi:hypothetical protein